jgi:hypothetical protein
MIEGASASQSFDGNKQQDEPEERSCAGTEEDRRPWFDDLNTT